MSVQEQEVAENMQELGFALENIEKQKEDLKIETEKERNKVKGIISNAGEALLLVNKDGLIEEANKAAKRLFASPNLKTVNLKTLLNIDKKVVISDFLKKNSGLISYANVVNKEGKILHIRISTTELNKGQNYSIFLSDLSELYGQIENAKEERSMLLGVVQKVKNKAEKKASITTQELEKLLNDVKDLK